MAGSRPESDWPLAKASGELGRARVLSPAWPCAKTFAELVANSAWLRAKTSGQPCPGPGLVARDTAV
ncbi:hypothetical protein [Streptomyces acidiscabies]|uniref:Uncharacterized protein n=1 Tax=Streptomyces acidiscabies TaxID=42234 RepID=A0AAP6BJJ9_9ACTN|nr:hypothetical protein [Streptomyces acidiscabies]MDX2965951.1 hypothetical protein [Streptomyces acidiscabies]MDX3024761.1 hypothetical protein [Streptomyces acidiscabies]